jgi:hypothetical protein
MRRKMTVNAYFRKLSVFSIILLAAASCGLQVRAQKAILSLDTSSIRIGEHVQLRLNATLPKSTTIYWPVITDTLSASVEVASKSKIDTSSTSRKEFLNYNQVITITSFDTGFHYIPPFTIHYSYSGDTARHELLSEGIYLKVRAVDVDTTQAIKDIKGPIQAPITFSELAPYIGFTLAIVIIIALVWYYFWRKRINKPLFPVITRPVGPPWETALQSLDSLDEKRLWQSGKIKEYYTELTDIIRHYLHQQHGIEAMEMVTSEILAGYDAAGLKPDSRTILNSILAQADYAKFAKVIPGRQENELSMMQSKQFIIDTKPVPAEPEAKNSENNLTQPTEPQIKG